MKLAPLLAQYLYENHRLDLPGIGSFILDRAVTVDLSMSRQGKIPKLEGISFEANNTIKESPELINYISKESGKIKALAAADLDSHLELAKQFMNIGKPFPFEGIGSLAKLQGGKYEFCAGMILPEKIREFTIREKTTDVYGEEPMPDYKSILYLKKLKKNWKRPVIAFMIIAGLAITVWAGWLVSKKSSHTEIAEVPAVMKEELVLSKDTLQVALVTTAAVTDSVKKDSAIIQPALNGSYKFVIETAARERAMKRYSYLKNNGLRVEMETRDSSQFKLFFRLHASPADTTHILDSLRNFYTPYWSKAFIDY